MRRRVCAIDHLRKRIGKRGGGQAAIQMTHDAQIILRTFEQGIRDVASSYPKYIHITLR